MLHSEGGRKEEGRDMPVGDQRYALGDPRHAGWLDWLDWLDWLEGHCRKVLPLLCCTRLRLVS